MEHGVGDKGRQEGRVEGKRKGGGNWKVKMGEAWRGRARKEIS